MKNFMKSLTLSQIQRVLSDNKITQPIDEFAGLRAAVSIVLRMKAGSTEILFIVRALREGDPWSGQIAFPGGHSEPQDQSMRETAERETTEETGIDLKKVATLFGRDRADQGDTKKNRKGVKGIPFCLFA